MERLLVAVASGLSCLAAHAQLYHSFEAPVFEASPGGSSIEGVGGWYEPVGVRPHHAYTYQDNAFGFVQNPVGGNQFIAGEVWRSGYTPRAQTRFEFTKGTWTVAYDMAANYIESSQSAPRINLSSFSPQHETAERGEFRHFQALNNFRDLSDPFRGWRADFNVYNEAGISIGNRSPGPAWLQLEVNHWYRQYITIDFAKNQITEVRLVDLHTGESTTANPPGWYLTGGAESTLLLPDAVRFFVGGTGYGIGGNAMGWDNLHIVPAPGAAGLLLGVGLIAAPRRRRANAAP